MHRTLRISAILRTTVLVAGKNGYGSLSALLISTLDKLTYRSSPRKLAGCLENATSFTRQNSSII